MNKLNDLLEKLARPLKNYSTYILRIGLGISFFLHGYGKIPIQQGFIDWLASKGIPFADLTAFLVAWGGNVIWYWNLNWRINRYECPSNWKFDH